MTTECTTDASVDSVLSILRDSQHRLADAVASLDETGALQQSYDDDWSIAQVLSHLGSQTEVHELIFDAMTTGGSTPGIEQMQPIWDRWNAKTPLEQVRDSIEADRRYLTRVESLTADGRDYSLDVFGRERSLANVVAMRVAEHAMHTWDVVVVLEPNATVQASAIETLLAWVAEFAGYVGKAPDPLRVLVRTQEPDREFVLGIGPDGGRISAADDVPVDGSLSLSAEAFVRLVYGRLDADHRPPVAAEGVELETLIAAFPGF